MKTFTLLAVLFTLNSCNTAIGLWRDTKQAGSWTQQKIQGTGGDSGPANDSGLPVY